MAPKSYDYGMKAWHEPDSPTVDICFIHGLTGHRDKTWTADGSGNEPWPKTLLPEKFPEARLLTFGYDADVVRAGVASKSSIKNLADKLLFALTTDRGPNAPHRPLIFVVHSLGGIVCKKAVARSTNDSNETLHSVATSLIGIVFMGTPHDGSGFADLFGLFAPGIRIIKSLNRRLVDVLKRGNELAAEIDNDFWNAWKVIEKDFNAQIEIFCFFEVLPMPGVKTCVVPEKSAIYQQHHSQSIDANHSNMVKFQSAEDPGFMSLYGVLRGFLRSNRASLLFSRGGGPPSFPVSIANVQPGASSSPAPPEPLGCESHMSPASTSPSTKNPNRQRHYLPFLSNHNFVGRENILKDLRQLLFEDKDTHPIVALYGLGGIGKTQVANALAHWTKNHRKECSVFWVPAVSKASFEKACGAIAKTWGIKCAGNEDIKTLVCDHLSSEAAGEWLLIIDNADDPDLIVGRDTPDSLDQYFPRSDSGRTLVTTRTQSVSQAVAQKTIPLEAFDLPQARQLATKLLERPDMLNDSASMDELLQELEYLPLAISQAMAYIKQLNLSAVEYLKLLRRTNTDRLDLLGKEIPDSIRYKESRHAVATTWLVSFDNLQKASPGAVSLLEFLSQIQPKAIPWSLLPNEKSNAALHNAVLDLCKYSFVSKHDDVLDMHSLVHMAICSWLEKNGRIEMVAISALRHVSAIFPTNDYENQDIWRAYLPHALYIIRDIKAVTSEEGLALCQMVSLCLRKDGRVKEELWCLMHVVAVRDKKFTEDHPDRLASQHELAIAYQSNGQIQEVVEILEHVVAICKKLTEDHPDRLASQHALAIAYRNNGQIQEAVEILEHVVAIKGKKLTEDHPDRLASQHELAMAYQSNGQIQEAVEILEHVVAVEGKKLTEDHPNRLASQHELARAYKSNGQFQEAVEILEHVVVVEGKKLTEDHPNRLASQHELARAYQSNGQIQEAVEILEHVVAVEGKKLTEDHPSRLASQHALGRAYQSNGQIQEAVEILEHVVAVEGKKLTEDHPDRLISQHALASVLWDRGETTRAIELMRHVAGMWRSRPNHPNGRLTHEKLAWMEERYICVGQHEEEVCGWCF